MNNPFGAQVEALNSQKKSLERSKKSPEQKEMEKQVKSEGNKKISSVVNGFNAHIASVEAQGAKAIARAQNPDQRRKIEADVRQQIARLKARKRMMIAAIKNQIEMQIQNIEIRYKKQKSMALRTLTEKILEFQEKKMQYDKVIEMQKVAGAAGSAKSAEGGQIAA